MSLLKEITSNSSPAWPRAFMLFNTELRIHRFLGTSFPDLPTNTGPIDRIIISNCPNLISLVNLPKKRVDDALEVLTISQCDSLTSLEGMPEDIKTLEISNCSSLTSLKYICTSVLRLHLSRLKNLKQIDAFPSLVSTAYIGQCSKITSISGLNNFCKSLISLRMDNEVIPTGLLALLKINNLKSIEFNINPNEKTQKLSFKAIEIFSRYLPKGDILDCQEEMIEAGLSEYATL